MACPNNARTCFQTGGQTCPEHGPDALQAYFKRAQNMVQLRVCARVALTWLDMLHACAQTCS
eukprot:972216-Lingulodinium_polyedra.AAC.1